MSQVTAKMPGYLRFTWMFFMQPIRLHQQLISCGIVNPNESGWQLYWTLGPRREIRHVYLRRLALLLLAFSSVTTVIAAGCLAGAGALASWPFFAIAVALGIAVGAGLAVTFGVRSAFRGTIVGVFVGLALGMVSNWPEALFALAFPLGVALGIIRDAIHGVEKGTTKVIDDETLRKVVRTTAFMPLGCGLALALVLALISGGKAGVDFATALAFLAIFGLMSGLPFLIAFVVTIFRLPLWPIEAILQMALYCFRNSLSRQSLNYSPVNWHNLSYIPLPLLSVHIQVTGQVDPELARRTLDACAITPGQRKVGQRSLAELQGHELEQIAVVGQFKAFVSEETTWLPPEASFNRVLEQFRQTARFVVAAESSSFPHYRREHLRQAQKSLAGIEIQLLAARAGINATLFRALPAWQKALTQLQNSADHEARLFLPMPFCAGEPLEPKRGQEVFRGREISIKEIEAHLALSTDARSVILLGPRRTGKSSILQMLPLMLPDAVCIFFDLQGHPIETPGRFFQALAQSVRVQAWRSKRLNLPELGPGLPFESAAAWIEALENSLGERRLLICLDEFEALENAFSSRTERLRLLGLLRSTIQHRRKVRLLVSGEAPFDELDPMWDSHFVSVREVRLGHLEPEVAVELVRKPIAEFPDDAIPEDVARRLVDLTGAQPFLVQLLAQLLVSRLNDEKRRSATLADLEAVEEEALGQVGPYFRDLWNRAPPPARDVLAGLARGERPEVPRNARRWLERRCLIREDGALSIPIFGRFLLEEILD